MKNVFSAIALLGMLIVLLGLLIFICYFILGSSEPDWPFKMMGVGMILYVIGTVIKAIADRSSDNDENDSIQ